MNNLRPKNESLARFYRPKTFDDICGQDSIIKILKRQIDLHEFKNVYLFCGSSGCGKTTTARAFATLINNGNGTPIEIDAASNNGVDNVRTLVKTASERAVDSEYKIVIIDECVTGDTEVLTNKGWKRFDDLDKTELIAQYNNGNVEFVKPTEYIEKEYNGDMYDVKIGNKAIFTMSPNHVQPLYFNKSQKIKEFYVKDTKFTHNSRFIRSGNGVGDLIHLSTLDKIAIMLQADGCLQGVKNNYNYWTIQVKKSSKKNQLTNLLNNCNLEYKQLHTTREGILRYSIKTPLNITKKLNTYFDLDRMSATYAKEFIEELMLWDGYVNSQREKYLYYSCVDKDNVDFCQCVGILGGFMSRVAVREDNRSEKYNTLYRLYLTPQTLSTSNGSVSKDCVQFDGKIYCVKVPSHMIFIRKNGYEMVTGNCHSLTSQAWQSFLKCIEEPPKYTIFIFCTTDPQKIPDTILNRVMRFNFNKIPVNQIKNRLEYICKLEGFTNYDETCDYISKICNGQMRDGIALLDKCASYNEDLSIDNVIYALGDYSYNIYFDLINKIIDGNTKEVLGDLTSIYNSGNDLKLFIEKFLEFCVDVEKYIIMQDCSVTKIPSTMEEKLKNSINFNGADSYYLYILNNLLELKNNLKTDVNPFSTIQVVFMKMCRCQ